MNEQQWIEEIIKLTDNTNTATDKQLRILEAAIEIFSEKGYSNSSTSEIAKKAGVAEGTIFRHYKTKKELLLAIVTPTLTKVVVPFFAKDFVKDIFEKNYTNYEAFLRALILNRFQFVKTRLPIIRIFLQEVAFHPELSKEFGKLFTEHVHPQFSKIVHHFQKQGELVDFPPDTIIRLTITTIVGHLLTRFLILPENDWDDEQEIENTIRFIVTGLRV